MVDDSSKASNSNLRDSETEPPTKKPGLDSMSNGMFTVWFLFSFMRLSVFCCCSFLTVDTAKSTKIAQANDTGADETIRSSETSNPNHVMANTEPIEASSADETEAPKKETIASNETSNPNYESINEEIDGQSSLSSSTHSTKRKDTAQGRSRKRAPEVDSGLLAKVRKSLNLANLAAATECHDAVDEDVEEQSSSLHLRQSTKNGKKIGGTATVGQASNHANPVAHTDRHDSLDEEIQSNVSRSNNTEDNKNAKQTEDSSGNDTETPTKCANFGTTGKGMYTIGSVFDSSD